MADRVPEPAAIGMYARKWTGAKKVAAAPVPHPEPEVRSRPATPEEISSSAEKMAREAAGWGWYVMITYARGTVMHRTGKPGAVVDSIAVRMWRGADIAVGIWYDGRWEEGLTPLRVYPTRAAFEAILFTPSRAPTKRATVRRDGTASAHTDGDKGTEMPNVISAPTGAVKVAGEVRGPATWKQYADGSWYEFVKGVDFGEGATVDNGVHANKSRAAFLGLISAWARRPKNGYQVEYTEVGDNLQLRLVKAEKSAAPAESPAPAEGSAPAENTAATPFDPAPAA